MQMRAATLCQCLAKRTTCQEGSEMVVAMGDVGVRGAATNTPAFLSAGSVHHLLSNIWGVFPKIDPKD